MIKSLGLTILALVFAMLLGELGLRGLGYKPWHYIQSRPGDPTMHAPDASFGWIKLPGKYTVSPFSSSGNLTNVTFLSNSSRATSERKDRDGSPELLFVGGSYTEGEAVDDTETFAWNIQNIFPQFHVLNYGTGGYGTYQSYLSLQKELPTLTNPKMVFYGFIDHHQVRNVATSEWLRILTGHSIKYPLKVPFVSLLDNGELVEHDPVEYLQLPLHEISALITLLERSYMKVWSSKREQHKVEATKALITRLQKLSEKFGAKFAVVFLEIDDNLKQDYMDYLDVNSIEFIDCSINLTPELIVVGQGHPNAAANLIWSNCLSLRIGYIH